MKNMHAALALCSLMTSLVLSLAAGSVETIPQATKYLSQFGYIPPLANRDSGEAVLDSTTWTNAIKEFQEFGGLNVTGDLDQETLDLMSLPRCGVRDKFNFRSKRYILQGNKLKVKNVKYRIINYPKRLKRSDVDAEIARAFSVWSEYANLKFTAKQSNPVHIEISFEVDSHGDVDAFDGPGGTLAHAHFPGYGSDVHFDDAEFWTIGSYRGKNLFQVAVHEIGHSLGLKHSDVKASVMVPFYRSYDPVFKLYPDDISAIQALYGEKITAVDDHLSKDESELCKDPKIDAIFNSYDSSSTYVFKGDKYYKLINNSIVDGYPKNISEGWPGLPGDIDAAYTNRKGKTYFFKGTQYWKYTDRQLSDNFPREISDGFQDIPDHLDAVMVRNNSREIYFFKDSSFWVHNPFTYPNVKPIYPKEISSHFKNLPKTIDTVFEHTNGLIYFFKGSKYYRINDQKIAVDTANPPFPRSTALWWFGCENAPESNEIDGNDESMERD